MAAIEFLTIDMLGPGIHCYPCVRKTVKDQVGAVGVTVEATSLYMVGLYVLCRLDRHIGCNTKAEGFAAVFTVDISVLKGYQDKPYKDDQDDDHPAGFNDPF